MPRVQNVVKPDTPAYIYDGAAGKAGKSPIVNPNRHGAAPQTSAKHSVMPKTVLTIR